MLKYNFDTFIICIYYLMGFSENINEDQFNLVFLLLALYPFSYIMSLIKDPRTKMMYSSFTGLLSLIYFYKYTSLILVFQQFACWSLLHLVSKKTNCILTLLISFGCLSYVNYIRMFWDNNESWKIEIDIPMVISTLKISSIPFVLYDGSIDESLLSKEQKELKIVETPTLLEYMGYIMFLPSAIIGPFFEYKIYYNYMYNLEDFDLNINKSSKWPTVFNRSLKALVYTFIYIVTQKYFNYKIFYEENRNFDFLDIINFLMGFTLKFKYIIGWMFNEAHLAICGVSYSKINNDYENVKIVDDYNVVIEPRPNEILKVINFENFRIGI